MNFSQIIRNEKIVQALTEHGITSPTEIQSKAIPVGIEGKDIIAKSQTGTGKTLAFTLPILEKITDEKCLQALILCPTRELSMQVAKEINKYIKYLDNVNVVAVYGGARIDEQIRKLKSRPQIVVATPGRLIDHISRRTIKTKDIKIAVLDEADEMISIGFKDELEKILSYLPSDRQTMFFSATFPTKVANLSKDYLNDPVKIQQNKKEEVVENISQYYTKMNQSSKDEALKRFIFLNDGLSIVFCNTKKRVDEVVSKLQSFGIIAEAIHGDLNQQMRENVMNKMKSGILDVLVATDVAARGIDIKDVKFVYNYDLPDDFEYYVHRIGRTGRAGNTGASFTFVTQREMGKITQLERVVKTSLTYVEIPSVEEVNTSRIYNYFNNLDFDDQENEILEEIVEQGFTFKQIANALLNDKFSHNDFEAIKTKKERGKKERRSNKDGVRLFLSVGKKDNIKVKHIVGAVARQTKIKSDDISNIEIKNAYSFITIPKQYQKEISRIKVINDVYVSVEVAKKRR